MEPEGDGRPERPELLVVVVDVANIRPRHKSDVEGQRSSGPTSLTFIDLCLNSIQLAARGAIVVKFADRSLLDALPAPDREEVLRRSELHFAEPDKIFLVPYADRPILAGAHDLEATIISNDRFKDPKLDEFKVSEVRHFRHHYDKADNSFNFPAMSDGRQLDRWWSLQFRDVPDMWFVSEEYLEIDWQLRDRIHEVTFQWRSEPITHRPQVPAPIGAGILAAEDEFDLQADSPPDLVPAGNRFGTPEQAPYVEPARRKLRLPIAFMDDLESVIELHGEEARVVGQLGRGTDGSLVLRWFEGGPHAKFAPLSTPTSMPEGAWVSVPCRVNDGEVVRLELLRGETVESLSFEEVLTLRNNVGSTTTSPPGRGTWAVPGFARPLVYLNLLRRRGGGRTRTGNQGRNDSDTRRLRHVAVFRDGREAREERWLTDEEETLAGLEYAEKLQQWKSAQAQEQERRRREGEAERKKKEEELAERFRQEWDERRRQAAKQAERKRELVERREREREVQRRLQEEYLAELAAARRRRVVVVVLVLTIVAAGAVMLISAFSGGDGAGAVSAVAGSSRAVITVHVR